MDTSSKNIQILLILKTINYAIYKNENSESHSPDAYYTIVVFSRNKLPSAESKTP